MTTKNKISTTSTKIISTSFPTSDADILAQKYLALKEKEEALKAEREELNSEIRSLVVDNSLVTSHGTFVIQTRRTLSWSISALKSVMGREWTSFVTPDSKLVKARMETKDEIGCLLETQSEVSISEALTFKKK